MQAATLLGIVLAITVLFFIIIVRIMILDNDKLHNKLIGTQMKLNLAESELNIAKTLHQISLTARPSFDETTKKLIILAIKNTNDNEAKSAALTACRRIAREFK